MVIDFQRRLCKNCAEVLQAELRHPTERNCSIPAALQNLVEAARRSGSSMWREELGLVEMLFTYIGDFAKFESYADWRPVLVDILTSHEEVRRRRLAEAIDYSGGERMKDDIIDDFFGEMRQGCNQNEDHSVRGSTGESSNVCSQSLMENSHKVGHEDDNYFIESDGIPSRICKCVDDNMKVENDEMIEEESAGEQSESKMFEESVVCLEKERGDTSDFGNDRGASKIADEKALSEGNEQEIQHQPRPGNFNCFICGKSFVLRHRWTRHMRYHNVGSFRCDNCDTIFHSKADLKTHMRTHSGERPFACDLCGRAFAQKRYLIAHMPTHSGERPFPCDLCGRAFARKSTLMKHMQTHSSGQRPFPCQLCGKAFRVSSELRRHLKSCFDSSVKVSSFA